MSDVQPKLKRASGTIKSVMHDMLSREKGDRGAWETVGAALLEARGSFPNPVEFGAWIAKEGIDKLPGLASASSRSDCIWLAERPLCAGLIPLHISNPRKVRTAWRKLLTKVAWAWVTSGALPESILHHITQETHATDDEASAALSAADKAMAALSAADKAHGLSLVPVLVAEVAAVTKAEAALHKALLKAKHSGVVTDQVLDMAASVGFAVYPPAHPWTPPPEAVTPAMRFEHGLRMALVEGVLPGEIDALIPSVTFYNSEMAAERARAALELAKEKAFDLEEAKAMVKDVYFGDF